MFTVKYEAGTLTKLSFLESVCPVFWNAILIKKYIYISINYEYQHKKTFIMASFFNPNKMFFLICHVF